MSICVTQLYISPNGETKAKTEYLSSKQTKTMQTIKLNEAVGRAVEILGANNAPFSAHDITDKIRGFVNNGNYLVDGYSESDEHVQEIPHIDVRNEVVSLYNQNKLDRVHNGSYFVYTVAPQVVKVHPADNQTQSNDELEQKIEIIVKDYYFRIYAFFSKSAEIIDDLDDLNLVDLCSEIEQQLELEDAINLDIETSLHSTVSSFVKSVASYIKTNKLLPAQPATDTVTKSAPQPNPVDLVDNKTPPDELEQKIEERIKTFLLERDSTFTKDLMLKDRLDDLDIVEIYMYIEEDLNIENLIDLDNDQAPNLTFGSWIKNIADYIRKNNLLPAAKPTALVTTTINPVESVGEFVKNYINHFGILNF